MGRRHLSVSHKSNAPLFGGGNPIALKALVSEELARIFDETPLAAGQHLTPPRSNSGNRALLEVEVPDSWQLRWWLLSQGGKIEVITPMALRKEVADTLSGAAAQYK